MKTKDLRNQDSNLKNPEKVESPKLPENTPNVDDLEGKGKTNPPESEAQSHKPTFGKSAEKPGIEQTEPEGDHTIPTGQEPLNPANPATQPSDSTEDQTSPGSRIMGEKAQENYDNIAKLGEGGGAERALDSSSTPENLKANSEAQTKENQNDGADEADPENHEVSEEVKEDLRELEAQQLIQQNPDAWQKAIHNPTTEDALASPISRPKTIDPQTGQVHYAGEEASVTPQAAAEGQESKD